MYWLVDSLGEASVMEQKIVPDGYPEIILHFGDPYCINLTGDWENQSMFLLSGQLKQFFYLKNIGISRMIGIKFYPTALYELFGLEMSQITNRVIQLPEEIQEILAPIISQNSPDFEDATKELNWIFEKHTENMHKEASVKRCVVHILNHKGLIQIDELLNVSALNKRQLERHFQKQVGLSAKFFSRLIRLTNVFQLMKNNDKEWMDLVFDSGFYDQPHFIKNFKEFTGEEPTKYGFNNKDMANFHLIQR